MKRPAKSCKAVFAAGCFLLAMMGIVGQAYGATQPTFVYATSPNPAGAGTVLGYAVDSTTGVLTPVPNSPFATGVEPVALTVTPSNKFLYVANYGIDGPGEIYAYTVDGTTGALTEVSGSPFAVCGAALSLAIDPSSKFLYVGCDGSGNNLWGFAINGTTGALTPVPGSPYNPAPISYETGWNSWAIAVDPSGKFLYDATEIGSLLTYGINSSTGALTSVSSTPYGPGSQPPAMQVDPLGKFVYVTGMRNVDAFTVNSTTGQLTAVSGSPFESGFSDVLSLAIDPLGRFAYTTNYNPDNLSAYTVNGTTGALTPITGSPFAWTTAPLSMAMDPSGKFVYITFNGSSNGVAAYTINATNGTLAAIAGSPFGVGAKPGALAITHDPSTVPFKTFDAHVWIDEDRKTSFRVEGSFTLGEGAAAIDPVSDSVELQLGTFSVTVPSGSFKEHRKHEYEFEGRINGVDLHFTIHQLRDRDYRFNVDGSATISSWFTNPVSVGLTIGDNVGTASVKADIDK